MNDFKSIRNRDAWATIRGFVYQAELTILRWLSLQTDQVLILEMGEDIDTVTHALDAPEEEAHRLLEQVKHRDNNVTLRDSAVVGFLASAHQHLQLNASKNITLRYITNAQPTHERPNLFTPRQKALQVWMDLSSKPSTALSQDPRLPGLLTGLQNLSRPDDLAPSTWDSFISFTKTITTENISDFIKSIDWSFGIGQAHNLKDQITDKLLEKHATTAAEATAGYERIFAHIFATLSKSGLKKLTPLDLKNITAGLGLDQTSIQRINIAQNLLSALNSRMGDVETILTKQQITLNEIDSAVNNLVSQHQQTPQIKYAPIRTNTRTYPPLEPGAERTDLSKRILTSLETKPWIAITGDHGAGKTQLVRRVGEYHLPRLHWLRLRGLSAEAASTLIFNTTNALTTEAASRPLLVLDDLPRIQNGDLLSEHLTNIIQDTTPHAAQIISSSNHQLPARLLAALENSIEPLPIPRFTDSEAQSLFAAAKAPLSFLQNNKLIETLNALAGGHPTLLQAMSRYLKKANWAISDESTLAGIFRRDYAQSIQAEIQTIIKSTVSEPESRELLYRLDIVIGTISEQDIRTICSISPPIEHPLEHTAELTGLWLQSDDRQTYVLSPLLKQFGKANLPQARFQLVNQSLAESILARGTISPTDVDRCIAYFAAAELAERAATLLLAGLSMIIKHKSSSSWRHSAWLSYWADSPLPAKMSLDAKIVFRGIQTQARELYSLPIDFALKDLDVLLESAGPREREAVIIACTSAVSVDVSSPPERNFKYSKTALQAWQSSLPMGDPAARGTLPPQVEWALWVMATSVRSISNLENWIDMFEALSPEQQTLAVQSQMAASGTMLMVDQLWMHEQEKDSHLQNWPSIITAIARWHDKAKLLKRAELSAAAMRALIAIKAEVESLPKEAIVLAQEELTHHAKDSLPAFMINECTGRNLAYKDMWPEAFHHLSAATQYTGTELPVERILAHLEASHAASRLGNPDRIPLAQKAVAIADDSATVSSVDRVKALAELGIAIWQTHGLPQAFDTWNLAAKELLRVTAEDPRRNGLFRVFGHCTGYFMMLARTGHPPGPLANGQPHAAPQSRFFLGDLIRLGHQFNELNIAYLYAQMAWFADGLNNVSQAEYWALQGLDATELARLPIAQSVLVQQSLPHLLGANVFGRVIDNAPHFAHSKKYDSHAREELTRQLIYPPVALRLATLALTDSPTAQLAANEVATSFISISNKSDLPAPWRTAANLVQELTQKSNTASTYFNHPKAKDFPREWPLYFMSNIFGSIQQTCPIGLAAAVQSDSLAHLYKNTNPDHSMTGRIILPFISAFWMKTWTERHFLFNTPKLLINILKEPASLNQARQILDAVLQDQATKPTDTAKQWLSLHDAP
ncbi:hypothetical protein EJ065_6217 [Corallococcus coralloides]|uniref:Uncharacterized protein n=1 Tax=Corallococcus coralloides TaxID=184914 RepID=A0A410S0Z6_CORCK|nr:hypothetical protein [Corallococcus coralloides]QAT87746.1 hypothetical protein EJ065_6217 [Corallococcus coralloides]